MPLWVPLHICRHSTADGTWRRFDLTYHSADTGHTKQRRSIGLKQTQEVYNQDRLFNILLEYNVSEACLAASSTAGKDTATNAKGGIVQGHAYSILKVLTSATDVGCNDGEHESPLSFFLYFFLLKGICTRNMNILWEVLKPNP